MNQIIQNDSCTKFIKPELLKLLCKTENSFEDFSLFLRTYPRLHNFVNDILNEKNISVI